MSDFTFEHDLPHQTAAVEAVMGALTRLDFIRPTNPQKNGVFISTNCEILDVAMETGTGKTYTYTKTIFELNKSYGINKFIIVVPSISIKLGSSSFLRSSAAREHFRSDYKNQDIKLYEVKAKSKKGEKPQAIYDFCRASNENQIHVLIMNSQLLNQKYGTIDSHYDASLLEDIFNPAEAISAINPIVIVDEPHKLISSNSAFKNLMRKFSPQLMIRFGATFAGDEKNVVYRLTAVDAFNQDLVKGIVIHTASDSSGAGNNVVVKLIKIENGTSAIFELHENGKTRRFSLHKGDGMDIIHPEMKSLKVENLKSDLVMLSNGLELKRGMSINPYSYNESIRNRMIQQAVNKHFEIERELLLQSPRIKPLTLFFIDDIESYRRPDGEFRKFFESTVKSQIEKILKNEEDPIYIAHLKNALKDITSIHGGYFSEDNTSKDEAIMGQIEDILKDKKRILSIDNPRRFIFSMWALREGWDNPNIFQICKLRSSGSETSKLQEVGRGLRLPVNEYMNRVKDKTHYLHYHVDFTELDFAKRLISEINSASGIDDNTQALTDELLDVILKKLPSSISKSDLLSDLDKKGIINRENKFLDGGFDRLKEMYPMAFTSLKRGVISSDTKPDKSVSIRHGKYDELRDLWESISQKVVLEYRFKPNQAGKMFMEFMKTHLNGLEKSGFSTKQQRVIRSKSGVELGEIERTMSHDAHVRTMYYKEFVQELSKSISLSPKTLHATFLDLMNMYGFNINPYMSLATIRYITHGFKEFMMEHMLEHYEVGYKRSTARIHPTKLTEANGSVKRIIENSSDLGLMKFEAEFGAPNGYLFNEIFYDSDIELENIMAGISGIAEIIVYTKIPKNSIQIPLVDGNSYSPDFAYVIKTNTGERVLNLIMESKGKSEGDLSVNEKAKIKHAEEFFSCVPSSISVKFKRQLKAQDLSSIIRGVIDDQQKTEKQ